MSNFKFKTYGETLDSVLDTMDELSFLQLVDLLRDKFSDKKDFLFKIFLACSLNSSTFTSLIEDEDYFYEKYGDDCFNLEDAFYYVGTSEFVNDAIKNDELSQLKRNLIELTYKAEEIIKTNVVNLFEYYLNDKKETKK